MQWHIDRNKRIRKYSAVLSCLESTGRHERNLQTQVGNCATIIDNQLVERMEMSIYAY